MNTIFFVLLFLFVNCISLYAQDGWEPEVIFDEKTELSTIQKVEFGKKAILMTNQLGYYIETVLRKDMSPILKDSAIANARRLFINPDKNIIQVMVRRNLRTQDADLIDFDGNNLNKSRNEIKKILKKKNALVEYSPVDEYFNELKYISDSNIYHKVQVNSTDAVFLPEKNLERGIDGNYYGTAYFCRTFEGIIKKDGKIIRQKTRNCYQVDIVIEQIILADGSMDWRVRLGNIYMVE